MTQYHVIANFAVDADTADEAMEVVNASMPSVGGVRIHGTIGVLTSVTTGIPSAGRVSGPAVQIDASDIRDEMADEMSGWTETAWHLIDQMPDSDLNAELSMGFDDDFWEAVSQVRLDAIHNLLEHAGLPFDERRTTT